MTGATDAICLSCNAVNALSENTLDTLTKAGTTTCTGCGEEVKSGLIVSSQSGKTLELEAVLNQ